MLCKALLDAALQLWDPERGQRRDRLPFGRGSDVRYFRRLGEAGNLGLGRSKLRTELNQVVLRKLGGLGVLLDDYVLGGILGSELRS